MRTPVRDRERRAGGVLSGYPLDRLYEEMAFISYYFHWPPDEVMNLEHRERRRWCDEISRVNQKVNQNVQAYEERLAK